MEESNMQYGHIMPKQKPFTIIVTFHFDYKWMFPISFNIFSSYCIFLQFIHIKTDVFFNFHSCSDMSHDVSSAAAAAAASVEGGCLLLAQAVLPSVTVI